MANALMTCIVLKSNVTVMDVVSTKMLGQFGFLVSYLAFCGEHGSPISWPCCSWMAKSSRS